MERTRQLDARQFTSREGKQTIRSRDSIAIYSGSGSAWKTAHAMYASARLLQ